MINMDNKMIEQLRKDDLKGDRLAAKLLEVIFGFEDLEQSLQTRGCLIL
jgi:hypothetical protein